MAGQGEDRRSTLDLSALITALRAETRTPSSAYIAYRDACRAMRTSWPSTTQYVVLLHTLARFPALDMGIRAEVEAVRAMHYHDVPAAEVEVT